MNIKFMLFHNIITPFAEVFIEQISFLSTCEFKLRFFEQQNLIY